jgi:transcriptional regulator with XRE-family HTH domain
MALILGECQLRKLRESKGLSQVALSVELKEKYDLSVSSTLISQYELGKKKLNPLVSRALCKVLGCVEEDLYNFIET